MADDLVIVYDNFDFQEGVKYQLVGNHEAMRSVTTGKFIHSTDIPSGELKQSMFHGHIPLCLHGLLGSPGLYQDGIANYISTYFSFKAIKDCYSSTVSCIFKSDKHLLLKMPQLNILLP